MNLEEVLEAELELQIAKNSIDELSLADLEA
jgi:hypothetical protein